MIVGGRRKKNKRVAGVEGKKEKWRVREKKEEGKRNDVVNLKSCFYNVQDFFKKNQFNVSNSNFDNNSFQFNNTIFL